MPTKTDRRVKKNVVLEYSVPIAEVRGEIEENKDFEISGIAVSETISRNDIKYTAKELKKAAPSLVGKPILDTHNRETIKAILGKVVEATYDDANKNIPFTGKIMDSTVRKMIKDGRVSNVSIGAQVGELVEEVVEENGKEITCYTATDIDFLELSVVSVPGVLGATLSSAISEAFLDNKEADNKEEKEEGESNMTEDLKKVLEEQFKALDAKVTAISEDLRKVKEEAEEKEKEETEKEAEAEKEAEEKARKALEEKLSALEEANKKLQKQVEESKVEGKGEVSPETKDENAEPSNFVIEKTRDGTSFWIMPGTRGELR